MGQALAIKKENNEASKHLLNYHEELKTYEDKLNNFKVLGAMIYSDMPKGSDVGNPTLNKAIQSNELEYRKNWLEVVELTESTLSEKKKMFVNLRRLAMDIQFKQEVGRPGWVDYVSCKYSEWHYIKYGIAVQPSKQCMTKWWDDIVQVAARLAIRKGCL